MPVNGGSLQGWRGCTSVSSLSETNSTQAEAHKHTAPGAMHCCSPAGPKSPNWGAAPAYLPHDDALKNCCPFAVDSCWLCVGYKGALLPDNGRRAHSRGQVTCACRDKGRKGKLSAQHRRRCKSRRQRHVLGHTCKPGCDFEGKPQRLPAQENAVDSLPQPHLGCPM